MLLEALLTDALPRLAYCKHLYVLDAGRRPTPSAPSSPPVPRRSGVNEVLTMYGELKQANRQVKSAHPQVQRLFIEAESRRAGATA